MNVYGSGVNDEPPSTQFKNAQTNQKVEAALFRTKAYLARVNGMDKWEKLLTAVKMRTEE